MSYRHKRYLSYALITIFTLLIPFITINGNHLLLLSFDKFEFHFLGFAYTASELYIMPFLLIILFIGIFVTTSILGRFWCGWACPQTIFRVIYRDLIEGTLLDLRKINNKQKEIDYSKNKNLLKKFLALFLWGVISLIIASNFIWYFVPPEDFFANLKDPDEHRFMILFVLSTALFLFYDIVFVKEKFCTYICPYSRVQTVLYDNDTKQVVYDKNRGGAVYQDGEKFISNMKQWSLDEECTTCERCVKVCPTHIDIRKGLQLECINCLECADSCSSVMAKLDKKSLISWGSNHSVLHKLKNSMFSMRNNMYFALIIASILLATAFASSKEYVLVNVNKTTQLYRINKNGLVSNGYIVTIHNRQDRAYTYDIKLHDERFAIKQFNAFSLAPKRSRKKVLVLEAKQKLYLSNTQDTPLKLNITIFAKEDPKIQLTHEVAFIYPKDTLIK